MSRFQDLLDRIVFPRMSLQVTHEEGRFFLRWVEPEARCAVTGVLGPQYGRKWRLSSHMTDGEVVGTAFKALLTYQEHEARESFKFDGVSVYDSHVDIHKLVALHKTGEAVQGRHPVSVELEQRPVRR